MNNSGESSPKLYQTIIDSLLDKIDANQFSFELPFCTEKQLMEEFGVSRITAKRAITELEYQGILYRKRGVGSFVARDIYQKRAKKQITPSVFAFLLPFTVKQANIFNMITKINTKISSSNCFLSLFITDNSKSKEQAILKQLLEQNVAGIVLYPTSDNIHLELLNQFAFRGVPVIVIDQPIATPYLYNILCDNSTGAQKLTEHLISLGHKEISFFSIGNVVSLPSVAERLGGFLNTMQKFGLQIKPEFIISKTTDTSPEAVCAQLQSLMNAGVTAIVCENDSAAHLLIQSCNALSVKVPDDISICGFSDDYDDITSINQNETQIADYIGDIFLESLTPERKIPHKILVPADLRIKASTGPCPMGKN
ncbi:MAG: substrate-binding domain-containing protein [Acetatifactor sp.]|nr:substrate-binding domain-containing protein [Acetatifactor sp.]